MTTVGETWDEEKKTARHPRSFLNAARFREHVASPLFLRGSSFPSHRVIANMASSRELLAATKREIIVNRENFPSHRVAGCPNGE